ncbi:MAG TPA: hypothetical protein VFV46_07340 [Lacibacter sp.]|nr:hypothetical protein [Lacibacter sp.]
MWKLIALIASLTALALLANKLIDKWMNVPGADFNKMYDKTML